MRYRPLGRTGFDVSEIGYGAWGIGGKQWLGGSDAESRKALHRSFELGVNFVDTALAYGDGHSEQLTGEAVRSWPSPIAIATKVPPKNRIWPAPPGVPIEDVFPYSYILQCTDESLRNLGVERIDLQQLHVWNDEWSQSEVWQRAFETLKKAGKIRWSGISLSEHDPDSGVNAVRSGKVDAVQVIYNIFDPTPQERLFPAAQEHGVGILARVPFDEGSLTGSISEDTSFSPGEFRAFYFRDDRKQLVAERVRELEGELRDVDDNLPAVALRWCLSHPAVSTVIPGMRQVRNVEANCTVSDKGPLPAGLLDRLKRHAWKKNFYT